MKKLIIGLAVLVLLISGTSVTFGRGVEGKVTAWGLNVRTGPGTAYSIIGVLSQGDVVEVVGKNAASDWLQIAYSGQEGWVSAAYVDLSGSLTGVPEVSAPPPPTATMASPTAAPAFTGKLVFPVCNGCEIRRTPCRERG